VVSCKQREADGQRFAVTSSRAQALIDTGEMGRPTTKEGAKIGSQYRDSPMLIVPSAAGFPLVFKSARPRGRCRLSTTLGLAMTVAVLWMATVPFAPAATAGSGYQIGAALRRPFTSAASWLVDIRSTIGATPKLISTGHAWPYMSNKNNWLLIGRSNMKFIDIFRAALDRGVDTQHEGGTDVILMNMQYSPRRPTS
jgi:hypothetical protein